MMELGKVNKMIVTRKTQMGVYLNSQGNKDEDAVLLLKNRITQVIRVGGEVIVFIYKDSEDRIVATMNIYDMLSSESSYKKNDRVKGMIYSINKEMGAFVAVDNMYHGLILNKELFGYYAVGDIIEIRVKAVREDGKLELSTRNEAYKEIENDANKIMDRLKINGGILLLNDNSSPEHIKSELGISKAAFKRAVGRLMKEGAIEITDIGIKRMW